MFIYVYIILRSIAINWLMCLFFFFLLSSVLMYKLYLEKNAITPCLFLYIIYSYLKR